MEDDRDRLQPFERALKTWAEKPARLSPQQAASRVREAASRRQGRAHTRRQRRAHTCRTLLATAAVLAVALTLGIRRDRGIRAPVPPPTAHLEPAALDAGQALIWLDAETPLYMTFEAPQAPAAAPPPQGEEP